MAQFEYTVKDQTGKQLKGKITVETKRLAFEKLRNRGYRILEINEQQGTLLNREIHLMNPVNNKDFVVFLRQFTTIIRAGVTVVEGLDILAKQTSNKVLRATLIQVHDDIREGYTLSDTCAKFPKIFPQMFINLIRAGEASGTLDETLERLASYFEKQYRARQKIISALSYPAALSVLAVGIVIFLMLNVIPTFVELFESSNAKLPKITQFVLNVSEWTQSYWWTLILGVIVFIMGIQALRKNKKGKYYLDYFTLRFPIIGLLLQKFAIARMTRTLGSLMSTSVPILESLDIVERVLQNEVLARVIQESREDVENGLSMTYAMEKHWTFPPLVTQMIVVGESTGALDEMLNKVADFYEAEVETATDQFKALIEPIMIVVLATLIGTIVSAMLVPMFEIFNTIK